MNFDDSTVSAPRSQIMILIQSVPQALSASTRWNEVWCHLKLVGVHINTLPYRSQALTFIISPELYHERVQYNAVDIFAKGPRLPWQTWQKLPATPRFMCSKETTPHQNLRITLPW